jgi:hypothetical protein
MYILQCYVTDMYSHVTLDIHQNVNTCTYCNVCITHIFCKISLITLTHDNNIKNVHGNSCWNGHMYLYKIHVGLNKKCIDVISVFTKKISLSKPNLKKKGNRAFHKRYTLF